MQRVYKRDEELFPEPSYGYDRKRYAKELKHQVHLKELAEKLNKTRDIYLEKKMLELNNKRYQQMDKQNESAANSLRMTLTNMMNSGNRFSGGGQMGQNHQGQNQKMGGLGTIHEADVEDSFIQLNQQELRREELREKQQQLAKQDAQRKYMEEQSRVRQSNIRPRTPLQDGGDPLLGMKVERELEKYRKYLEFELPGEISNQVSDMFKFESQNLKDILRERDQLLKMQMSSFKDYLKIMEIDKDRELVDFKKLKQDMTHNKRLNKRRVLKIEEAMINTDKLMEDEYMPEELIGLEKKMDYFPTSSRFRSHNPMSQSLNFQPGSFTDRGHGGQLASASEFRDDMSIFANSGKDSLYRNVSMMNFPKKTNPQSSWMTPDNPHEQRHRSQRNRRVEKILGDLDNIMYDLNSELPNY